MANFSDYFKYLGPALTIAQELATAEMEFSTGQPVNVPGVRTYIGKQHVEIDLTIKPLA